MGCVGLRLLRILLTELVLFYVHVSSLYVSQKALLLGNLVNENR
jgi:hypothetical protein